LQNVKFLQVQIRINRCRNIWEPLENPAIKKAMKSWLNYVHDQC